jgi:secreted trypsin-like serine protease
MRPFRFHAAAVFAFLAASFPAFGIVTAGPPVDFVTPFGRGLDGVLQLWIDTSVASYQCSGVLLGSGRHVLTAAHCVTDASGKPDLVSFGALVETSKSVTMLNGTKVAVNPGYDGNLLDGNDLDVVTLDGTAPTEADRYSVYRRNDEVGQVGLLAGYGITGQGAADPSITPGQRMAGSNRYDADASAFGYAAGHNDLLYDFDNGSAANDGFGFFLGIHDLGEGPDEALTSFGDSGGPTFLDGQVAGIHSFVFRLTTAKGHTSDVDGVMNQSFGELGADVRLSQYADWIDRQMAVPDLPTAAPVALAIVLIALARGRSGTT